MECLRKAESVIHFKMLLYWFLCEIQAFNDYNIDFFSLFNKCHFKETP